MLFHTKIPKYLHILIIFSLFAQIMNITDNQYEHWWGYAALPEEVVYPYNGDNNPLTLICQFALGDGLVCVFADLDYFFGDLYADGGHIGEWKKDLYKVIYSPTRDKLHEHEIKYEDGTSAVPEPHSINGYDSLILCKPTTWQDELLNDYPDYQILVQVEEDDSINLRFYDCGTLFFLIKPEDLNARDFSKVKCVLYTY